MCYKETFFFYLLNRLLNCGETMLDLLSRMLDVTARIKAYARKGDEI